MLKQSVSLLVLVGLWRTLKLHQANQDVPGPWLCLWYTVERRTEYTILQVRGRPSWYWWNIGRVIHPVPHIPKSEADYRRRRHYGIGFSGQCVCGNICSPVLRAARKTRRSFTCTTCRITAHTVSARDKTFHSWRHCSILGLVKLNKQPAVHPTMYFHPN